jgi:hypothetical protein
MISNQSVIDQHNWNLRNMQMQSSGGSLEEQYKKMLAEFGQGGGSFDFSAQHKNDLEYLSAQSENMRRLAKQQSDDWLDVQGRLMSKSAEFRSQESAQQFGQDRQMQGDQLENQRAMQAKQFGQEREMFLEQERTDNERRNWERKSAIQAFKNL